MMRSSLAGGLLTLEAAVGRPAAAELPDAATFLADVGFSAEQVKQVEAGSIVTITFKPSTERELVAAFAFLVPAARAPS